jgi:hypothetical protein
MTLHSWPTVVRALITMHRNAYWSADTVVTALATSIDTQAHAALCREWRVLAARMRAGAP